jgi:glycosyltransferase involved in cell wall biosynthesis
VLIEAWSRVAEAAPGATLTLVGDGPERSALLAAADGVRSRSVHLVGFQGDVTGCLYGSDLFVQPSLAEGLPVAVLEAMACGLPVVATSVGGVGEAVDDGTTGLLVPAGDPGSLAEAMLELLRDPRRARKLGLAGRQRVVRRFDAPRMVEAYLELYRSFLSTVPSG